MADFSPQLRAVEAAEFSPDGQYAVSGSKFGYKVMLWRVADGTLAWEREHESEVECVVFSPDGKRIATGGEDYFVRIWDTETGEATASLGARQRAGRHHLVARRPVDRQRFGSGRSLSVGC